MYVLPTRSDDSEVSGDMYRRMTSRVPLDVLLKHLPWVETDNGGLRLTSAGPLAYKAHRHPITTPAVPLRDDARWQHRPLGPEASAPSADRVAVRGGGPPRPLRFGEFGNAVGGVRSPI